MPGSPVSQRNPQGGEGGQAGPGPGNVNQGGWKYVCRTSAVRSQQQNQEGERPSLKPQEGARLEGNT